MATNSKREVRLGVEIETTGEASIRKLSEDVRRLAKEGTDAAPEFSRLAGELDKLADQSGALTGLRALVKQVEDLTAQQAQAAAAVAATGAKYAEAQTKAAGLRQEQARLAEAVRAAKLEVVKADGDIKTYAAGFDRAGKASEEYRQRQGQLARVLADAKTALAGSRIELERIAPAVRTAVAEEAKLSNQVELLGEKARESQRELDRRNKTLEESAAATNLAGAGTSDLADAETRLLQSLQGVANEATRLAEAQREAASGADEGAAAIRALEQAAKAADAEFSKLERSLVEADRAAQALADAEGAAAIKALEQAAKAADAEFDRLTQSLRGAEAAAEQFAAASGRAAGASRDDAVAIQQRRVAADALLRSEEALDQTQRELAATRNAGRAALLAEAQALTAAARAADESREATERLVAASRRAGESIEQAFGATGIRSINAIEQEIRETEVALERLNAAARKGAIGTAELERAAGAAAVKINRLQAEVLQVQALPGTFERLGDSVNGLVTRFGALTAAVATVGFAVAPAVRSFIALESATRILTSITGSATVAAEQIEFLRGAAQRSGQSFDDLSKSYAKFAASALQTGLSLTDTQQVFDSVALAAGNLGLSSDQVGRALEALSQIASKGVVSMEELRGQLGDALPGALPLLARELGLTTSELNKVVESGELLAFEAIPAIGRALRALGTEGGKPVQGLVAEFNRLKNAVFEATNSIADGAVGRAIGAVLSTASLSVRGVVAVFDILGNVITSVGDKVGALAGAIRTLDFSGLSDAFKEIDNRSAVALDRIASRLQDVGAASTTAAAGTTALAAEVEKTTLALSAGTEASDAQVKSLAALALANKKGVEAATEASRIAEKLVQAKKDENDAIVRTVALAGDEAETRRVSARAAADLAAQTDALAAADRAVVTALESARSKTLEYAKANGASADAIKKSVESLDKQIAAKEADAEKSEQQAAATRAAAAAAELAAAATEDNADQYEALAQAVDDARVKLEDVVRAFRLDRASAEDVTRATEALALAKGKLKDASDDLVAASKRSVDALKAESEFTKAQIELELTRLRIRRDEAIALGNSTAATILGNQIRDLEIKVTQEGTAAKRKEAEEIIRVTQSQIEQQRSLGTLTPAREQELQTIIRQQEATILQTQAAEENERQQIRVNQGLAAGKAVRDSASSSTDGHTVSVERNTRSLASNATGIQRAIDLLEELAVAQRAIEGISAIRQPGDPGNRLAADGGTNFSVLGPTGSGPTYGGQIPRPTAPGNWTFDAEAYAAAGYPANPDIAKSYWRRTDLRSGPGFNAFGARSLTSVDSSGTPTAPMGSGTRPVTINVTIGGQTRTVTAASRSAAEEMVRALEDAYRAGGGG